MNWNGSELNLIHCFVGMDPSRPITPAAIFTLDSKYPNRVEVRVENQGDTLGNLIKCKLEEHIQVKQAAYRVPHRSDTFVLIQFTTQEGVAPDGIWKQVLEQLLAETKMWRESFQRFV